MQWTPKIINANTNIWFKIFQKETKLLDPTRKKYNTNLWADILELFYNEYKEWQISFTLFNL